MVAAKVANPSLPQLPAMKKFLTTAPVFAAIWFTITAVIMIEFNHFVPDMLFYQF
jgi:photosystem I subunit 9